MPAKVNSLRIKCGEVYTSDYNGELYAVECSLCADQQICSLAEFSEHMRIWHESWETIGKEDEEYIEQEPNEEQFKDIIVMDEYGLQMNLLSCEQEEDVVLCPLDVKEEEIVNSLPAPFEEVLIPLDKKSGIGAVKFEKKSTKLLGMGQVKDENPPGIKENQLPMDDIQQIPVVPDNEIWNGKVPDGSVTLFPHFEKSIKSDNSSVCSISDCTDISAESTNMESNSRLSDSQVHKLIALYQQHPQLWDPHDPDYCSRKQRRVSWRTLTETFNRDYQVMFSWKTLHRKLTDFARYYRRERERIEKNQLCTKWSFYDDFAFMNSEIIEANNLHRCLQHKDINLQIIAAYEARPPLWNIRHPDYAKRAQRQRHFDLMLAYLQKEINSQISEEKLKQRIIEFRFNYRMAKRLRIAAENLHETFTPQYEYYEALQFLDTHVAPFHCSTCVSSFKKLTDFLHHQQKDHLKNNCSTRRRKDSFDQADNCTENICHICGVQFTLRYNLLHHLERHVEQGAYSCSVCSKRFYTSTALRIHQYSHTKKYPFVCEKCGQSFVNISKLNEHIKRHTNQRDHKCDQCEKAFFTAFERDRHVRRHLNIRDKMCSVCGKTFVVGSSYYAHMMLHSEVKRYSCNACDAQFAQYAGLYKHRKKYHPQ